MRIFNHFRWSKKTEIVFLSFKYPLTTWLALAEDHTKNFSPFQNIEEKLHKFLHDFYTYLASKWASSATSGHQKWVETIVLSFDYPILTYSPFSGDYTKNFSPFWIDERYIMRIPRFLHIFGPKMSIFNHFRWPEMSFFLILSEPWGPIVHLQKTAYEKLPPLKFYNV